MITKFGDYLNENFEIKSKNVDSAFSEYETYLKNRLSTYNTQVNMISEVKKIIKKIQNAVKGSKYELEFVTTTDIPKYATDYFGRSFAIFVTKKDKNYFDKDVLTNIYDIIADTQYADSPGSDKYTDIINIFTDTTDEDFKSFDKILVYEFG